MRAASLLRSVGSVVFVGLVAGVVLAGCRSGTALHSRYNDFRAYYNAYYNAERKLEEGEEALQARNQRVDRGRLVELFPTGTSAGRSNTFQETVDKSAELLRERPGSKWADDALLLIGKAYFYQRNFVGAEQKFRETAEAAEVRDQQRLADEARFWLGRTFAATERYEDGLAVLQDALAQTEIDPRWRAQIQLALGELYGRAERWEDAAAAIREGIETVGDRELAARAYLLLGQVEESAGNWEAAANAYALSARRAPAYELEYAARLNEALVLGLDAGRYEEALERIRAMRRDDKNFQQRAEVELAWARIQATSGDAPGARRRFHNVLYDEDLAGGAIRGEAHYRLAEFYRDVEKNFVRASAHFDTAATELPAPPDASVRLSRAAIRDARRESETFTSIAAASQRISEIDSLVTLASLSEDAFEARIQEIEAERLRVFLEAQRETNQLRANEAFRDQTARGIGSGGTGAGGEQNDDSALRRNVAGFLGHRDPGAVQAGRIAFEQAWGERTLAPNWRRRAALTASVATTTGPDGVLSVTRLPTGQGPPPLDLSAIPRTPEQQRQLGIELAELRYELANALFLSLGRADSAVVLYQRILDETPDAPVAPRARYALAEVEYAAGRLEAATPLFQDVIDADPESELAHAARIRLGIEAEEAPEEESETSDRSAELFAAARSRWSGGDPLGAMQDFIALGEADPDAPIAPRAFLAGAAAYADFARGDSLILISALPDSLAPALFRDTTGTELASAGDEDVLDEDILEGEPDRVLPDEDIPSPPDADRLPDDDDELRRPNSPQPVALEEPDVDVDDEGIQRRQAPRPIEIPNPAQEVDDDDISERPRTDLEEADVPQMLRDQLDADSARAGVDSLAAPAGVPEPVMPDSVLASTVRPDTSRALGDSLRVEPDSLAIADSVQLPTFTLADYLDGLIERYPGSIEAARAQVLREALPRDPSTEPVEDHVEPEVASGAPHAPDEAAQPAPPEAPVAPPIDLDANPYGTFGVQPLNPAVGGFTRRTNGLADAVEASTLARQLIEEGFRAAVATDGEDIFVVVGQYPTDKDLAIASAELPAAALGAGTDVVRLEDIELLPLVDGEDGQ